MSNKQKSQPLATRKARMMKRKEGQGRTNDLLIFFKRLVFSHPNSFDSCNSWFFTASKRKRLQSAFTLLEVILALAILAGAIAVLGEVMSIAGRSASDAQAEAHAQLLASSMMDELLSGRVELANQTRQPLETDSAIPWVGSVTLGDTSLVGLMSVEVLVEQDVEKQFRPVKYRLIRWLSNETDTTDEESSSNTEDSRNA